MANEADQKGQIASSGLFLLINILLGDAKGGTEALRHFYVRQHE